MKRVKAKVLLVIALLIAGTTEAQIDTPAYQLVKKISLSGDGKWDYLKIDDEQKRLFVSHFDRVHVVDLNTGKQIGEIDSLNGVHGVALVKALEKGYITNGTVNTVTVFDYNTFQVIKTIKVSGVKPDCVIFDKVSDKIYAFCGDSHSVSIIDPHTNTETGTIELGGKPEFAVPDDKGLIFNNLEDKNEVVVIDVKLAKIVRRYALKTGVAPTGITIDNSTGRLFVACKESRNLLVLDAATGNQVDELPIGGKVDGVVYEKELKLIITSNGEGNASIIQQDGADSYKVIQTLQTRPGMKTLAYSGNTHQIFLSGAEIKDGTIQQGTFGVAVYGSAR
ncbi:40-residue YVTN family beta-propeller repeat-containing protein [Filimonas lacunae]|uniref:40-residue YVTN family beta-propeller repeat-containing protein n=1 Tax=Filimonas lacunae TaxID=477680 RepID=A0A173MD40_9BACT|nr:YncE family protein [Filimonas lacunae]BAV05502.1 gluconolactonase family protein [Filimonas lacunae]SIT20696.1 40-residue YVTN family beta-propeller repeat-containing protein [Filimonas lacunae]